MKITGNTILITGASSGIGRGLAEALHDRGNQVIIAGRRQALLDEVTAKRKGMASITLDVEDPKSLTHLRTEVTEKFLALNVLIANAGISRAEDMTSDDFDASAAEDIVETNILGVIRVTAALLPLVRKNAQKNPATFIATSSNLAFLPRSDFPTYCASKAFVHSWLQSLRHQLRKIPVEVLELSPPYVQTELTGAHQLQDPRAIPLDAYVKEVMHILETQNHPRGEVLVERGHERRTAERDGRYEELYDAVNPK